MDGRINERSKHILATGAFYTKGMQCFNLYLLHQNASYVLKYFCQLFTHVHHLWLPAAVAAMKVSRKHRQQRTIDRTVNRRNDIQEMTFNA